MIETVFNASRIVGLDACCELPFPSRGEALLTQRTLIAGLLLLAKKNLYIIDSFFQTSTGELVDAWDAPAEVRCGPPCAFNASLNHR